MDSMTKPFVVTIYLIYNLNEYKVYVGKTEKTLEKRWRQHKSAARVGKSPQYIHRAMRLYGIESFAIQKITEAYTKEEGYRLEKLYVSVHQSDNPKFGYNLTAGGDGVEANEATRKKISETHKRLGTKPPGNKGRKFSAEWIKHMSDGRKGIPAWNKGKKLSPEHIAALKSAVRPKVIPKDRHPEILLDDILCLYKSGEGLNCRDIARKYGVTKDTISRRLKKAGVVLRPVGFQKGPRKGSAKCGAT